jgi:hypothetical protein
MACIKGNGSFNRYENRANKVACCCDDICIIREHGNIKVDFLEYFRQLLKIGVELLSCLSDLSISLSAGQYFLSEAA